MRPARTVLTIAFLAMTVAAANAAQPKAVSVDLSGTIDGNGLKFAECDKPVYRVQLKATVDGNGEGDGTLVLDPTPPKVDEFGFVQRAEPLPPVKLECSLKLLKKQTLRMDPAGLPPEEVEWRLFSITGPKIKSRLSLATEGANWTWGRLLLADEDGDGRIAVTVREPAPQLFPPCHPGCFPAGTPIRTPDGPRTVESVRVGDVIDTVGPAGTPGEGKVTAVFATDNLLFEVRTEGGTLTTTETQPLALADGGLREAGELKAGDRILTWDGRQRRGVTVRSVSATGRQARVFNLVLGEPVLFVADGFLARSKPPAPAAEVIKP